MNIQTYRGYRVIESPYMEIENSTPNRQLTFKRWMKGLSYHSRISKKWIKRYGKKTGPCFIFTNCSIYTHPANMNLLKD